MSTMKFILIACLALFASIELSNAAEKQFYCIELETSTFVELEQVIDQLEGLGLVVRHILPPDQIIAKGPESLARKIKRIRQVKVLQYGKKGVGVEHRSSNSASAQMFTELLKPSQRLAAVLGDLFGLREVFKTIIDTIWLLLTISVNQHSRWELSLINT